ncbi:hypothetical protein niasHT_019054 [Heterodera trifolii]|uniref:Nitrogen permease regulator 2-like protein n=1 Tax=Heterodera trifolii TaxID=157864 RepID=A0ABD2LD41_9BILA
MRKPRIYRVPFRVLFAHLKRSCAVYILFYTIAYLFGAPFFSIRTAVFALDHFLLNYLPLACVCRHDIAQFWLCVDNRPRNLPQLYVSRSVLGSILGAWLGAVVIPLDWDQWWQAWPLCSHFGSLFGVLLAVLSAYFRIWTKPPFARPQKRKPSIAPYQNSNTSRSSAIVENMETGVEEQQTDNNPQQQQQQKHEPSLTPNTVNNAVGGVETAMMAHFDGHGERAATASPASSFEEAVPAETTRSNSGSGGEDEHDGTHHGNVDEAGDEHDGHGRQHRRHYQQQQEQQQRRQRQQKRCSRHFFSQEPPKLCSIIYAEFDNDIGRVIRYQVPDEIFDKQRFDTISSAIIPSEEMRDRMIKINMYDYKITGHPVGIKDKKYQREVFIFNLCFVVAASEADDSDDSIYYEPLAQKCAEYLVELEQERCFLSEEKDRLPALMHQIFDGLNQKGECVCPITDQTTVYLRLCPAFLCHEPPPHPLSPFLVPIFTRLPPPITRAALNRMDVLSQKICPEIDGVRCIKDIACAVQIDTDLVGRCVRNLCFYGCVALLPQFLYSNCYVPTERLRHFFDSPQIVEKCLDFVRLRPFSEDPSPVLFDDVARLYLGLKTGSPLSEWLLRMRPRQLHVDERKLIQFGLFYGILRKQNIYPVAIRRNDGTKIATLCDGEHSLDDLALHYTLSPVELQRLLAENGNFRFIAR